MRHPALLFLVPLVTATACGPRADLAYDTRVRYPTYVQHHPLVLIDQAHHNGHTLVGRYRPFAALLQNDGYEVRPSAVPFAPRVLHGASVLVIAAARGRPNKAAPAFTEAECDHVRDWVAAGGGLLLVTDHAPLGSPSEALAERFGVSMSKGETRDPRHQAGPDPAQLVFARADGLLGDHPIHRGRSPAERVNRVMTFTGHSLRGPPGSAALLPLSDTAVDLPLKSVTFRRGILSDDLIIALGKAVPARGSSQAVALEHVRGRVVVTAEAAMLTAQREGGEKFGMNLDGIDNRQLVLNIVHWLSGAL